MPSVDVIPWEKTEKGRAYRRKYSTEYYRKHREKMAADAVADKRAKRLEILMLLGRVCSKCGFSDPRALQVDHVNGDGATERKVTWGGTHRLLREIKQNPSRYQLLCANCNWIKRFENNEHGPKRRLPDWQP